MILKSCFLEVNSSDMKNSLVIFNCVLFLNYFVEFNMNIFDQLALYQKLNSHFVFLIFFSIEQLHD